MKTDMPMWLGISLLHHVGGVGAEHHELAVRHVDDAHDAERDRETDRGEHQHDAQAQTEEQASRASNTRAREESIDAMTSRAAVRTRSSGSGNEPSSARRDHGREPVVDIGAQRILQAPGRRRAACRPPALSRSASASPSRIACFTSASRFLLEPARRIATLSSSSERSISRTARGARPASGSASAKPATALRSVLRRLLLVVMREKSSGLPRARRTSASADR